MAHQPVGIIGGPSRFDIMTAVFDIEHPRLLTFRFQLMDERKGSADVWIAGATQGNRAVDEWHLKGFFMPQGMETKTRHLIPMQLNYSCQMRRGLIYRVDKKTLTGGDLAPDVLDLITWDS